MTTQSTPRLNPFEIFIGIIIITVMTAVLGGAILGFRELLLIIEEPDPVEQFIFTIAANIMFGLAALFFVILTAALIWKRLLRRP